jgi:hypothetical protein
LRSWRDSYRVASFVNRRADDLTSRIGQVVEFGQQCASDSATPRRLVEKIRRISAVSLSRA